MVVHLNVFRFEQYPMFLKLFKPFRKVQGIRVLHALTDKPSIILTFLTSISPGVAYGAVVGVEKSIREIP